MHQHRQTRTAHRDRPTPKSPPTPTLRPRLASLGAEPPLETKAPESRSGHEDGAGFYSYEDRAARPAPKWARDAAWAARAQAEQKDGFDARLRLARIPTAIAAPAEFGRKCAKAVRQQGRKGARDARPVCRARIADNASEERSLLSSQGRITHPMVSAPIARPLTSRSNGRGFDLTRERAPCARVSRRGPPFYTSVGPATRPPSSMACSPRQLGTKQPADCSQNIVPRVELGSGSPKPSG